MKRSFAILGLLLCSACGGAKPSTEVDDRHSVERLYPMPLGAAWSYDVDTGQGLPILAITRVTHVAPTQVEVTTGRDPVVYERRPEGLFRPDRQAYVLHAPVRVGATWDAGGGATAEVTSLEKSVETASGTFSGCAEIVETGGANGKVVRTVFCPDVGPVEVESTLPMPGGGAQARVYAKLRGVDLNAGRAAAAAQGGQ